MSKNGAKIAKIEKDSIADKIGLHEGDTILEINKEKVNDLIDLNYALADESIEILVQNSLGVTQTHYFQKRFGDTTGIEMENAVFDSIRQCANNCVFCFIDQMPEGMRESLYVKDDDYRMSFLHGNFITLTNMAERDWNRIRAFHLSPLYVSLHTTNGDLRKTMMKHNGADKILKHLAWLKENDIEIHAQIVMCPGYNDNEELRSTVETLYTSFDNVLDIAIVPIGLTKFRDNLPQIPPVDEIKAKETIAIIEPFQKKARLERGHSFVYLADEFYLQAKREYPSPDEYDDFGLLEDGIGMGRKFSLDWENYKTEDAYTYEKPFRVALPTGTAIGNDMKAFMKNLEIPNLEVSVIPIENKFFGSAINVTGLLTAQDIIEQVKGLNETFDGIIIPGVCLRKGVPIFLDDRTVHDVEQALGIEVRICHFATDLLEQLNHWR